MSKACLAAGLLAACLVVYPNQAMGQRRSPAPKPEKMTLTTRDGVDLGVTYYPSRLGDQAAPVVLLHDLKGSREIYANLAKRLNKPSSGDSHKPFAVLTVDLRGHGDSTNQEPPGGRPRQLEASKLRKKDFEAMVLGDLEAVRKFLVKENDAGKLNLNRLSVIGTGLGASVALNWAATDWSMPPLATVKQGQDVKALVLVSPRWKTGGLGIQNALRQPGVRQYVAMMLLYGAGEKRVAADSKRIFKQVERYHEAPESVPDGEVPSLVKFGPESELQGTELLKQLGRKAEDAMIKFLVEYSAKPELEWIKRVTE